MSKRKSTSKKVNPSLKDISNLDAKIVELLDERARLCKSSENEKSENNLVMTPAQKRAFLINLREAASGEFPIKTLEKIFTQIETSCSALKHNTKVAYFGPEATFTHMAALNEFGDSAEFTPYVTVHDVFHAVSQGWVDYGVVPIENSTGGMVHHTLDEFLDYDLTICSEVVLDIHHNLLSLYPLSKIKTIYSHPQPFLQCQIWLREKLPKAAHIEVTSTVEGAKRAGETPGSAAIASELAAELYNLPIRGRAIEDYTGNCTRFIVLGREPSPPSGNDKTSLLLSLKDRPGALYKALMPFSDTGLNLTKIESRPTKRKAWEYYFFIDLEGHCEDEKVKKVLKKTERLCVFFKILGSYPKGG